MRAALAILLLSVPALAADELADNLAGEWTFGASNTNAVAGHGRLTAAFSADGELTLLAWPGPSGPDQLLYFSSNDEDARTQPRMGAQEGMGSRLGLLVTTQSGTTLTWLRDWPHDQGYTQPDAPVPVTHFHHDALGLTATLVDVVLPDRDVLSRQLSLQRADGSPVTAASLVVYENLSPTLSEIPFIPLADWALPARSDFVAVWDADSQSILHVHPGDRGLTTSLDQLINPPADPDYGPADAVMKSTPDAAAAAAFAAQVDTAYPAGVAALVSTEPAPAAWQVGTDATPYCDQVKHMVDNIHGLPAKHPGISLPGAESADLLLCSDPMPGLRQSRGWTWAPADALADLAAGGPSGSVFAAGQTNGVLVAPLSFSNGVANGAALFALGATRAAAQAALAAAKAATPDQRQAASEQAAHGALAGAVLPDASLGDRARTVALRALVNIYVAREAATGAIVASVSRQPPYHLDWPRDGAFIDAALEVAGLSDWATQRLQWMAGLSRAQPTKGDPLLSPDVPTDPTSGARQFPAGAWEMNYAGDGVIGGPIRFEIDNTALHLWSLAAQAATLSSSARGQLLQATWPSAKTALQLLRDWHGTGGLPAPANEDDHEDLTSTLHGAVAVYAALVAGQRLARAQGDGPLQSSLQQRASDLRAAILSNYYDPASGLFRSERGGTPGAIGGPAGWMVWPARLLDKGDARIEKQLAAEMARALSDLRGETSGAGYLGKTIVAAALYGAAGGSRDQAREAVQRLANMATDGTFHFGEIFETQSDGTFLQAVATPHVWEGSLFYLAAMALSQPQRFNPEETALPLGGSGCDGSGPPEGLALAIVGLWLYRRRGTDRAWKTRTASIN